MEIISHAPCCKVVKKLFNSMDPLYFHTSIAHLRHGWACINQHLIKAKFRNHWNTFLSHPKLKLIHLLAWIHACIEDWIKLWSICFCSAGFDDAYFIATFLSVLWFYMVCMALFCYSYYLSDVSDWHPSSKGPNSRAKGINKNAAVKLLFKLLARSVFNFCSNELSNLTQLDLFVCFAMLQINW